MGKTGGEEEEERPCREREINPAPLPEGAGRSLRRPAGAKGEPAPGAPSRGRHRCLLPGGPGPGPQPPGPAPRGAPGAPRVRPPGTATRAAGSDREKECFKKIYINNNHTTVIRSRKERAPSQQAGSGIGSERKERSESGDKANIQIGYSTIKPGALIAILRAPWKLSNVKSVGTESNVRLHIPPCPRVSAPLLPTVLSASPLQCDPLCGHGSLLVPSHAWV